MAQNRLIYFFAEEKIYHALNVNALLIIATHSFNLNHPLAMQIIWNQIDQTKWDAAHASAGGYLQQDWHYGTSLLTKAVSCHRAQVIQDGQTIALAQFICRRYGGIAGFAICTRGPLWLKTLSASEQAQVYRALKRSLPIARPRFALFAPNILAPDDASLAGLVRVMTGHSTVLIDLLQSPEALRAAMDGKWRNRLVAAERAEIKIIRLAAEPAHYAWLLEEERAQRESKSFYGLPVKFVENFIHARSDTDKTSLILQAEAQGERIAAMLFLIHGSTATYHVGWSNDAGRATNAHNLLLWRALIALQENGIATLDMGGINTRSLPGISRFKIGSGGAVTTYAGTFV